MVAYKVYHLLSPAFDMPIEVKLNAEDRYLRVAGPFFEVVHFRTPLFHPQTLAVSNVYGVPVFQVAPVAGQPQRWAIQHEHQTLMQANFVDAASVQSNAGQAHDATELYPFAVLPGEQPNAAERQMLCAAFAVCCQHVQLLQEAIMA
ncbi:MAG: hypothetical protein MUF62_08535 [Chitinophagaceae bacterium]|jgi:hypothetical protein|nr:hypothetical protein [Chitinophagaceae bacterium]